MTEFKYLIQDPIGIHARPAGLLAKLAKSFEGTTVYLTKGGNTVKASQLTKSPAAAKAAMRQQLLQPWNSSLKRICKSVTRNNEKSRCLAFRAGISFFTIRR